MSNDLFYGVRNLHVVFHGNWSDPEIYYKRRYFNYYDVEYALYMDFEDEFSRKPTEQEFKKYVKNNAKNMLNGWIAI